MRLCPSCNREYKTGESVCPVCNAKIVETNEKGTARAISTLRLPKIPKKVILSVCALLLSVALIASGIGVLFYFMNNTPALLYLKNGDLYSTCETGRAKKLKEDIFKNMSEEEKDSFFEHLVKDENRQILIYPASTVYKTTETENLKSEPALRGDEEKVPYLTLKVLNLKNGKEYDIADEVTSFVYSSFGGVVIYEKSKDLYSYDVKEAKSTLLIENVRYYSLSESGEYMIYSDEDAKGTYWQRLGEETVFIEGISSFSKDLSTYAYIDSDDKLYMYSPATGSCFVSDDAYSLGGVYFTGEIYYLTVEECTYYYKDFVEDDIPDDRSEQAEKIREYVERGYVKRFKHCANHFDGKKTTQLYSYMTTLYPDGYYFSEHTSEMYEYPTMSAVCSKTVSENLQTYKLSTLMAAGEFFGDPLSTIGEPTVTWINTVFLNGEDCQRRFDGIDNVVCDPNFERVFFYVRDQESKRTNLYYSEIENGKAAYPKPFDKNMLKDSIQFLPDGTVTYFKEYMDYKRSGYLYRDRELLDKDAHIDSVAYSEELDALFWISGSDKEMTSGTLMMQKGGEILPVAYGIRDYRICCDGVYYIARSLSGEKYDLYFFNGEKTKRINTGVDSVIG